MKIARRKMTKNAFHPSQLQSEINGGAISAKFTRCTFGNHHQSFTFFYLHLLTIWLSAISNLEGSYRSKKIKHKVSEFNWEFEESLSSLCYLA